MERTTGVEPASEAWEAAVLPMNYVRKTVSALFTLVELAQIVTAGCRQWVVTAGCRHSFLTDTLHNFCCTRNFARK